MGVVHKLHDYEIAALHNLRLVAWQRRAEATDTSSNSTVGARIADKVAATMGSWPFIIIQSVILLIWIILNVTAYVEQWDPYPFILLNLALSFQAAYAAPFIMMCQNRQAEIDRAAAQTDYGINAKAELEIELLHSKIDVMRETEIAELVAVIKGLESRLPGVTK